MSVLHSTQAVPGPAQTHFPLLPSNLHPVVKHPIKESTHRVYECVELDLHVVMRLFGMVLMYRCSSQNTWEIRQQNLSFMTYICTFGFLTGH